MVKCLKSIYFDAQLMMNAEKEELDIALLCNEALKMALDPTNKAGEDLKNEVMLSKDNQILTRNSMNRTRLGRQKFEQLALAYATKYKLTLDEVIKRFYWK